MITVKVGLGPATYRIHESLLRHHFDKFRKALSDCWKEGEERTVGLEDLEPAAFDVFVDWLYTNKIPMSRDEWLKQTVGEDDNLYYCRESVLRLKTYVLADRLGALQLLKAVNKPYVNEYSDGAPFYEEIIYAFFNVSAGRRLLSFIVTQHCRHSETNHDDQYGWELELLGSLPHAFLLQAMKEYRRLCQEERFDEAVDVCDYHEYCSEKERNDCRQALRD